MDECQLLCYALISSMQRIAQSCRRSGEDEPRPYTIGRPMHDWETDLAAYDVGAQNAFMGAEGFVRLPMRLPSSTPVPLVALVVWAYRAMR